MHTCLFEGFERTDNAVLIDTQGTVIELKKTNFQSLMLTIEIKCNLLIGVNINVLYCLKKKALLTVLMFGFILNKVIESFYNLLQSVCTAMKCI